MALRTPFLYLLWQKQATTSKSVTKLLPLLGQEVQSGGLTAARPSTPDPFRSQDSPLAQLPAEALDCGAVAARLRKAFPVK